MRCNAKIAASLDALSEPLPSPAPIEGQPPRQGGKQMQMPVSLGGKRRIATALALYDRRHVADEFLAVASEHAPPVSLKDANKVFFSISYLPFLEIMMKSDLSALYSRRGQSRVGAAGRPSATVGRCGSGDAKSCARQAPS